MTQQPDIRTTPDGQLLLIWPDGHVSTYALTDLRTDCPCPVCQPKQRPVPIINYSGAVRFTRVALLVSLYLLPLALLFLLPTAETVVVSGPAVILISIWLFIAAQISHYPYARPLAICHLVLVLFLLTLADANHWSSYRAYGPFVMICTPYVVAAMAATWYAYRHPPPSVPAPSWNCRQCNYLLVGLTDHRCPECGKEFDPADLPATPPAAIQSGTP